MAAEAFASSIRVVIAALAMASLACLPASATIVGLNQIATPEIQPEGMLAVSVQGHNPALGNPWQLQLELGLTKRFEVALFRGFSPGQTVFNAEYAIVQTPSFLLSTGLLGVENKLRTQPFLEGGYYRGKGFVIAGIQEQESAILGVFGFGYHVAPRVQFWADYVSGPGNFATAGVSLDLSPNLVFNPAVYVSNGSPHRAYGYGVLTWSVKVW